MNGTLEQYTFPYSQWYMCTHTNTHIHTIAHQSCLIHTSLVTHFPSRITRLPIHSFLPLTSHSSAMSPSHQSLISHVSLSPDTSLPHQSCLPLTSSHPPCSIHVHNVSIGSLSPDITMTYDNFRVPPILHLFYLLKWLWSKSKSYRFVKRSCQVASGCSNLTT